MSSLSFLNCLTALTSASGPSTSIADFYNSTGLKLLYAHNYAYVMPIVKWGETIQDELNSGWSREIEHDLAGRGDVSCVHRLCLPARTVRRTRGGASRLRR